MKYPNNTPNSGDPAAPIILSTERLNAAVDEQLAAISTTGTGLTPSQVNTDQLRAAVRIIRNLPVDEIKILPHHYT